MKKVKGYLIPDIINPQDEVCYSVPVPNDPAYIRAFFGQLNELSRWGMWDKTPQKQGVEAAARWFDSYLRITACENNVIIKDEDCSFANPTSPLITYAPNDPYQTPDLIPDGYLLPPWRILGGNPHTDLLSIPTNILELPDLILNSGLPRFKVRFRGEGHVQLYLRDIPQGGYVYVTLDGSPIGTFAEMAGISVFDFSSWLQLILALIGASLDGNLTNQHVVEIPVSGSGEHYIDVTALPNISASTLLGFGFQVEKVKICTDEPQVLEEPVPQFQVNNCILEWRPNPEAAWAALGNVCGADGQDGANAPIPIFAWQGTILKIDPDADGDFDLQQDLKGADGQDGQDGVCLDCEGSYDNLADTAYLCRAAWVASEAYIQEFSFSLYNIGGNDTELGIIYQDGLPRSARGTNFVPDWTDVPQWARQYFAEQIMTVNDWEMYLREHVRCVLLHHWQADTSLQTFVIYGDTVLNADDYDTRYLEAIEAIEVQSTNYYGLNLLAGIIADMVAIHCRFAYPSFKAATYYEANLQPTFPVPDCDECLYMTTEPSNLSYLCRAAEIAAHDFFWNVTDSFGGNSLLGIGADYQRILDPHITLPDPSPVNFVDIPPAVQTWFVSYMWSYTANRAAVIASLKAKLYEDWFADPDLSTFEDLGETETLNPTYDNDINDAKAWYDLAYPLDTVIDKVTDGLVKIIAIAFYQDFTPNQYATYVWANQAINEGSGDCNPPLGSGCWEWNFLTSQHDFVVTPGWSTINWQSGVGLVATQSGSQWRVEVTSPTWANAATIVRIEVDCDFHSGSNAANQSLALNNNGLVWVMEDYTPLEGDGITVVADGFSQLGDKLRLSFATTDIGDPGSCTVRKVRMYFESSTNPFPELACP